MIRSILTLVLTTLAIGIPLPASDMATPLLDAIAFGDAASEQRHRCTSERSETITGGLGQPARRLLPGGTHPWEGGSLTWTMAMDPKEQNYLTVKFWGSDQGADAGRLILHIDGMQCGYWRESDHDVLNQCEEDPWAPGRFAYVTLPLPPQVTAGRTSVALTIIAYGRAWYYGANWEQFQKPLTQPTRGIYRAYAHTAPRFTPPADEPQGRTPDAPVRATHGPEVIDQTRTIVINRLKGFTTGPRPVPGNLKSIQAELWLLAEAYQRAWTPTFHHARVIEQIVRDGDALVTGDATDGKYLEKEWMGAGPLGKAITLTWPAIEPHLATTITVGRTTMTRREAWARLLRKGLDYWRTHRRSFTNQSMIVDLGLYTANRGLLLIQPDRALPEARVLRYLLESAGIEPWLGSDAPEGASIPERDTPERGQLKPFGDHHHLISRKGLSRELGYVASYGETILTFVREMAELTGDARLRDQLRRLQAARTHFRYPGIDADGFRCMKLASEIDNRHAHCPQIGAAYNATGVRESWWMEVPALLTDDPVAVGAAQQSVADGQYFAYVASRLKDPDTLGMMRNVDEWEKVRSLPPSPWRLPMTPGQPDHAFADEENAVLALKRGDTCLFINFYFRAERAVNRIARVFEQTPIMNRLATVRTGVEVIGSSQVYTRPDWLLGIRNAGFRPPGPKLRQAWAGEQMPIAKRPDGAISPAYGEWGPFVGKAAFYSLRYGDYLIGMNTTEANTYTLPVPVKQGQARDLISGHMMDLGRDVAVGPLTTVVLYLGASSGK